MPPKLHILTTLDGSDQAEAALRFARMIAAGNADITVLRVVSDRETLFDTSGFLVVPAEEEFAAQRDDAKSQSQASVAKFDDLPGVQWDIATLIGDPAETILEQAEARHVDMIVMSSTGKGAFARLTVGSVADRISRAACVPVLIARAASEAVVRRVLVPIDGSERVAAELPVARELALRLGASIKFIYVVDYSQIATGLSAFAPAAQAQMLVAATTAGQLSIDDAVAQMLAAGISASGVILRGIPAEAILEESKPGDLIVMCSHGRSGFTRWLIGSVAEKLIHIGSTPVMLVPVRALARAESVVITI